MAKNAILLFLAVMIIPQIDWRIWLDMFPELRDIAQCESGLNPNARHINKNGTVDGGLFQINSVHGLGKKVYDPMFSLSWAIQKYYDGDLDIWVCHSQNNN